MGITVGTRLTLGLGWDRSEDPPFDLDLAVLCLTPEGKLPRGFADVVYTGHRRHDSGGITLLTDNLTGAGSGDDEVIWLDLDQLPPMITQLRVVVILDCGLELGQDLQQVPNGYWRVMDLTQNREILRHPLRDPALAGKTALMASSLKRQDQGWSLETSLEAQVTDQLQTLIQPFL